MATLITKNSSTASSVPTNAQLVQGELAVNVTDKRLYTENASGTVVELGTNPGSAVTHTAGTAGAPAITTTGDTNTGIFFPAADTVAASVGGTEGLRLTSTGLGVGTTSPAYKLQVNGGRAVFTGSNENYTVGIGRESNTNAYYLGVHSTTNPNLLFSNNAGTTNLTLTYDGNLGLGVTPSAWDSGRPAVQVGGTVSYFIGNSVVALGANHYFNGGNKYVGTGNATQYAQSAGQHIWLTAASGTAGNAISFTQAMTLDASGNLGVGVTAPATRLEVLGANEGEYFRAGGGTISARSLQFSSFTVSGLTGVGHQINVPNASGVLTFATGSTERCRITSGGDLLVGTTSGIVAQTGVTSTHNISTNVDTGYGLTVSNTSGGAFGLGIKYTAHSPNNAGNSFVWCSDGGGTQRASIYSNGGLANYSGNNVNLSDRREKTNFAPAKDYLDTICAIPVQTFNYIDQSEDDPGTTLGVVAQDVQAVAPELVMESNWGTKDDPKMRLSIYQTDLQYALMKCIQELKAELDSVKAELNALKGT